METRQEKRISSLRIKATAILGSLSLLASGCVIERSLKPWEDEVLRNPEAMSSLVCPEDLVNKAEELRARVDENTGETIGLFQDVAKEYENAYQSMVEAGLNDPDCDTAELIGQLTISGYHDPESGSNGRVVTTSDFLER